MNGIYWLIKIQSVAFTLLRWKMITPLHLWRKQDNSLFARRSNQKHYQPGSLKYIDHNGTELLNETGPRLRDSQAIDIILVHLCSHYVEQRPTVY